MKAAPAGTGSIAKQARTIMEAEDLNLTQFAAKAGVDIGTMSAAINTGRPVNLQTALKVCNAYQISMDWFLGLTDREQPIRGRYNTAPIEETEKTFSRRLRSAAAGKRYTTSSLAKQIGVASSTVLMHMNARFLPRSDTLVLYCKVLGVSADWLLGRV